MPYDPNNAASLDDANGPPRAGEFGGMAPPPIQVPCSADDHPGGDWTEAQREEIVDLYFEPILTYCHRRFFKEEDAEEVAQRAFEQLFEYQHAYDPTKAKSGVRGYLYAIARQVCNRTLNERYPFFLQMQAPKAASLVVGWPAACDFLVSPLTADCALVVAPSWLTLHRVKKNRVTATWRIEGTAPHAGDWKIKIVVSDWEKEFSAQIELQARDKADATSLPPEKPVDLSKLKPIGLRAEYEPVRDAEDHAGTSAPTFGDRERLRRMLAMLSEDERRLVEMRFLNDKPVKEIAAIVGKLPNTVSVAILRALERMRRYGDDEDRQAGVCGPVR